VATVLPSAHKLNRRSSMQVARSAFEAGYACSTVVSKRMSCFARPRYGTFVATSVNFPPVRARSGQCYGLYGELRILDRAVLSC